MQKAIKSFVAYAKNEGCQNSVLYHMHFTKMVFNCLNKIMTNDDEYLYFVYLRIIEDIVKKRLIKEMDKGEHYKIIYTLVRQDIENYARSLLLDYQKTKGIK